MAPPSFRHSKRARATSLPPAWPYLQKWPVLHYGGVPRIDLATWDFVIDGLVEMPTRLSYSDVQQLPRKTLQTDVHCVTRWSLLGSSWEGIPIDELMKLVHVKPEATHVLVHAEQGYTTNLSLDDFLRAREHAGRPARRRADQPGPRLAAAIVRAAPVLLEKRQMGTPARVSEPRPTWLLGGIRLSQSRRSLEGRTVRLDLHANLKQFDQVTHLIGPVGW